MLVEAVLFVICLVCLYFALRKPPNLPPGIWGLPVLGKFPSSSERLSHQVKALRPRYGDIILWRVGGRLLLFLCNYKLIRRALNRQDFTDRPDYATFLAYGDGHLRGVVFNSGAKWLMHRRFVLHHLRNLGMGKTKVEQDIREEAALLVEDFKKHTNEDNHLPCSLGVAVFNVIWKMVASTRFDPDDKEAHEFTRQVERIMLSFQGPVFIFNFFPWLEHYAPLWLRRKWGLEKTINLAKTTHGITKKYVEQHQKTFDQDNLRDLIDEYLYALKDPEQQSTFSLEDLCTLATDFFVAGTETTISTLRWTILYLTKYPEVQRRVQREIDDVIPRGTIPQYQDKNRLPYFEAVLSEVHRIVSFFPFAISHFVSEDTELEGYTIPKGTIIHPHLECCHKDPAVWERPDEFYPEHFLDADGKFVNREALMPFSVGRRSCIGESLARVELVIFLVTLLQNFTFTAPDGEPLSTENDPDERVANFPKPFRVIITERE